MKTYTGRVRLGAGHSLIVAHGPRLSQMTFDPNTAKQQISQFGLFNMATPDSHTFYKDVKPEDLEIKPEDFIRPVFRGLSEVTVRKHFDPIDFSDSGVLKASMPLIVGQTVFSNHESFVGNEKGVVAKSFWQNKYDVGGLAIPAGMNLEFMIDTKLHPKLAREIQSDPPTVHSNSVTVQFQWQQSHPKMRFEDFRAKVGTFDEKGELIRRVASMIDAYHETSLVAHGADPFAQLITKDGIINNPTYAVSRDSFSEHLDKKKSPYYFFDFKESFSEKSNNTQTDNDNEDEESSQKQISNIMKFTKAQIALMAALAGITLTAEQNTHLQLADAEFEAQFDFEAFGAQLTVDALTATQTSLTAAATLATEKSTLETEKADLQTKLTAAEQFKTENEAKLADLTVLDTFKSAQLAEVKRLAVLADPTQATKLEAVYNAANLETLQAFQTQLASQVDEKFPVECAKCGSHEISRKSASVENDDDDDKNQVEQEDLVDRMARKKGSISILS